MKFDSAGRLVTPESALGQVTRIDLGSGARETIARVPRGIDNIALSPDDRLFISHFVDGRVSEALADGTERILSASGLVGPFGLARLADGRMLVADGLSVAVVDADGTLTRTHTLIADLPTLAVGAATLDGDPIVLGQRGQVFRCRAGEAGGAHRRPARRPDRPGRQRRRRPCSSPSSGAGPGRPGRRDRRDR